MKLKFIYTFFTLCICAVLFMANEEGRAGDQNSGNTGAPGDEIAGGNLRTCQNCHNSGSFQATLDIEIEDGDGNAITAYQPGTVYSMTVTVASDVGNPAGYGFQMVSLKAPLDVNGDDVAGFSNASANAQIVVTTSAGTGRQYVEQSTQSPVGVFSVDWQAPAAGTGPVTFYSCGNTVNDNNMTSGDNSACNKLELPEMTTSADDLSAVATVSVYPNPAVEQFQVRIDSKTTGVFTASLYDLRGQLVQQEQLDVATGAMTYEFPISELANGVYMLRLSDGTRYTTTRVVKQ